MIADKAKFERKKPGAWCNMVTFSAKSTRLPDPRVVRLVVRAAPGRDRESGVTLIEMMVVLVIIAIVAALIVPNVSAGRTRRG